MIHSIVAILVSIFFLIGEASALSDSWMKVRFFQKSGSMNVVDVSWEVRRDHSMILNLPAADPQGWMASIHSDRCASIGGRFVRRLSPKDHDQLTSLMSTAINEQLQKKPKNRDVKPAPAPTGYFKLEVFESGKLRTASVTDRNQPAIRAVLQWMQKQYSDLFQSRSQVVELKITQHNPIQVELRNAGKLSVLIPIPDQPGDAFRLMDQQGQYVKAKWLNRPQSDSMELQPGQVIRLELAVPADVSSKITEIRFETRPIQHHLPRGRTAPELSLCAKLK
jgi:hypothetical protein